MSAANMYTWHEVLTGGSDLNDQDAAERFYQRNWIDTWNLATERSKTPSGDGRGFSLTGLIKQARRRYGDVENRGGRLYAVEHEARGEPGEQDEFGVVKNVDPRSPMPPSQDGWRMALRDLYGHEDIFKATHALQKNANPEEGEAPEFDKVVKGLREQDAVNETDAPDLSDLDLDDPEDREVALSTTEEIVSKANIDSSTVQAATPVEFDPDLFNTIRTAAPHTTVIDQVAQAGFTASYNIISGRSSPIGRVGEGDAMDLSNNTPQDFTLTNAQDDMKIYVDLVDVSDFSQRAESTLGFMDLFGTSIQQRTLEGALFQAKEFYYGDSSQGESNGSVEDSNASDGLRKIANDANGSYVKSKTSTSLSGDKALFKDIKAEINALVRNQPVTYNDLQIMTSLDVFDALEDEAQVNVRLDTFDGPVNFGGRTLSIAGVPITPDPNIRSYGDLSGTSTKGDVFLMDTRAVQDRVLAPFSTMPLGRIGLGDRAALFKYNRTIDKSQGEHLRVLQDYQVSGLPTV